MVMPDVLPEFYPDLKDPRLEASVCVFHQRFSTNTLPEWRLAQPFRFLAHNGEINTIQGNRNWAVARAANFRSEKLQDLSDLDPIVALDGSDSSTLDNMLERSEEHTSELQSRENLVCRLLLEKKNKTKK